MEAKQVQTLPTSEQWILALQRAATQSLAVWPPLVLAWLLIVSVHRNAVAFDFGHAYLPAARAILDGVSPYPPTTAVAVAGDAFVYPPLTAFLAVPFTALPPLAAELIVTGLAILSVLLILYVLGVRDWRCYAISFLWAPMFSAIQTANVTLLIAVGLAIAWRFRRSALVVSVVGGLLIAVKLFMWPLLVWLVATRRYRAAVGTVLATTVFVFVPWAAIGFTGLARYPHLVHVLTEAEQRYRYTIMAVIGASTPWGVAEVVAAGVGLAVLVACWRAGRSEKPASFALMIATALLLTPIVSMHFFVLLLLVPLSLFRPRFSWPWVAPVLLWVGPAVANGATWQTAAVMLIAFGTFAAVLPVRSARGQLA